MFFYSSKWIYVHTATQWQRRDKKLGAQSWAVQSITVFCNGMLKKAVVLKEIFSSVF